MKPRLLDLIRDHADSKHPLLDCKDCPVCEWMLRQHQQSDGDV